MKKIIKIPIAVLLSLLVITSSIVVAFAATDSIQGMGYSYYEKGDCTVDYGGEVYVSSNYTITHKFTVNGNIATCAWSSNATPAKGTYKSTTKYYLANSYLRAKAFYWLFVSNGSTISSSAAKYHSTSNTYKDDLDYAVSSAGSSGTYAFAHCVVDYLQQGKTNAYCDAAWNKTVVAFANKVKNYPDVPYQYKIFYFYPKGNQAQSLMSWEYTPHGYIKVIKSSANTSVTNGNANYSFADIQYYVSKSKTDFDTTGSNYLGYIKLNAAGEGHSKDGSRATLRTLPEGTYYVKEGYVPAGSSYEKNDTVYTVKVTRNHTTTQPLVLRVSDEPKTCYGKIVKASTKPELTNGNDAYSMEGIQYAFSTSNTDFNPNGDKYIGYVELDKDGVGYTANGSRATLRELAPGTYYVKEAVIPDGCKYKMDNTVYTMTFTFDNDKNHLKVLNVKDEPEGSSSAKVIKKSSLPDVTDGNPLYSLEGAEFTFYKSNADAKQGVNAYATITTDENGVALLNDIELGTYYVKETKAPNSFELSEEIKEIKIETAQEEAYEIEFEDKPIVANISALLQKKNASDKVTNQDMSGAEYTVKYYADNLNEEAVAEATPSKTWVFVTDTDNLCKYDVEHLKSGDALYRDGAGNYVLPFGTISIQETAAPDGFYLDENVYVRQITKNTAQNITQYNLPVSNEFEIPTVDLSGKKIWNDDNNRDGKRPQSVTVELYRDGERIDSFTMSERTAWKYEFNDLPKGYADLSLDDHIYFYQYEVKEGAVQYYESESTGVDADPDDSNHLICDFTNHYTPEMMKIDGIKTWSDYENSFGYRPETIKIILNRDGVKYKETTTSKAKSWKYAFNNLYKYHDGGKEYVYTVTEEPVPGYALKVDGFNMKNTLQTGSVTLNKTDGKSEPLEGVTFKLFTDSGKPVASVESKNGYRFFELTDNEDEAVYTTDSNGQIKVSDLPIGDYYFVEEDTSAGFIKLEEKIPFTISTDSEEMLHAAVDVENAKAVMPNTGGSGVAVFYIISALLAMTVAMLFYKKSKTRKD